MKGDKKCIQCGDMFPVRNIKRSTASYCRKCRFIINMVRLPHSGHRLILPEPVVPRKRTPRTFKGVDYSR